MKVLLIDNYDSFSYNLAQLLRQSGLCEYDVVLNDQILLEEIAQYDKILISPGPGLPAEAGITNAVISAFAPVKSILGICLGHQAIAEVFGARLFQMPFAQHGQTVRAQLLSKSDLLFTGLPETFMVALYHSWSVDGASLPSSLRVTATTDDGHILGIRHHLYDVAGLQFHPESVATEFGFAIILNWLKG